MDIPDIDSLGAVEQKILHYLQYEFPVASHPYAALAAELGMSEDEVVLTIQGLKKAGYIRRMGASINSRKLGYKSTLIALKVSEVRLPEVTAMINCLPGVTHNYLREGEYNVWFTLIMPDEKSMADSLDEVSRAEGVEACLSLPARKIFKLNVKFPIRDGYKTPICVVAPQPFA